MKRCRRWTNWKSPGSSRRWYRNYRAAPAVTGLAEDDVASLPDADAVEDTPPEAEQDSTDAESADDAGSVQPEETAETVSPVQRLANSLPNWTPCITTSCWFPRMSIKNRLQR